MGNDLYRHSVWIDVFGVVLFGAVVLGGAVYLLSHAGGVASGLSGGASQHQTTYSSAPSPQPRSSGRASGRLASSQSKGSPLLSGRRGPTASGAEAPFSSEWRDQATPGLGAASESASEGSAGQAGSASRWPDASPTASPSARSGWTEAAQGDRSGGAAGPGWRREARKLASRAQALSGQLRQLEREANSKAEQKRTASEETAGEATTGSASTSDRDAPNPPSVPIDDHLHWLLVAGVLWGAWRIWRGAA